MSNMRDLLDKLNELTEDNDLVELHDSFDIEINESFVIETGVIGFTDDGIIVEADEQMLEFLDINDIILESEDVEEGWKSKLAGAALAGAAALGAGGAHAGGITLGGGGHTMQDQIRMNQQMSQQAMQQAPKQDLSGFSTEYLQKVANVDPNAPIKPRFMVSPEAAKAELAARAAGTSAQKVPAEKPQSAQGAGFSKEYLEKVANGQHPRPMISAEEAQKLLKQMNEGKEESSEDGDSEYDEDDPRHPGYAERRAEQDEYKRDKFRHGDFNEAEYQGRKVPLGKPMAGDVKKSKVYVKKPNGKVVKVNFGDKNMKIKKSNPNRRKSFRARHRCENPGPRWKARYWSCRAW